MGECVFNTSLTGYQEILTDPSYKGQFVVFTYPHIGNVGINVEDMESTQCHLGGVIVRDLSLKVSNYRSTMTLDAYLKKQKVRPTPFTISVLFLYFLVLFGSVG